MHRLDICRATGRHLEQTVEHDGRIAAPVMLDGEVSELFVDKRALRFDLTGIAGGAFLAGEGDRRCHPDGCARLNLFRLRPADPHSGAPADDNLR